jgi:hypothetical protein
MDLAMKIPTLSALCVVLAACSGSPGTYAPAGSADNPVVTTFAAGEPATVSVRVTDREPVERVELTDPAGRAYVAHQIDRERLSRSYGRYGPSTGVGVGVGVGGGDVAVGSGVGFSFPLFGGGYDDTPYGRHVASTALVRVPDMAAYRAEWPRWKVRVYLGEGAGRRMIEVAAPPPPAG